MTHMLENDKILRAQFLSWNGHQPALLCLNGINCLPELKYPISGLVYNAQWSPVVNMVNDASAWLDNIPVIAMSENMHIYVWSMNNYG